MELLRTPDARFENLPDYPFEPKYLEVDGIRMHYVDEGPRDAAPVLMLHGEPSWSYLYRKMIPPIVAAGYRAVAPDLIGFGRSDKPAKRADYTYQRHVDWCLSFIEQLDLRDITFFGQDWGGLIGLRIFAEHPARFTRVIAANTFLPTGLQPLGEAFHRWCEYSQATPVFPAGQIVQRGTVSQLSDDVVAAYDAPFPDETFKEGARQFPVLVPASPKDPASPANQKAWEYLFSCNKPFLTAFGDGDPITRGGEHLFQQTVPGTKGQPHVIIEGAGHFLQEDRGEQLAEVVLRFMKG